MKSMFRWLSALALCALLQSCATSHLMEWSRGDSSAFDQPPEKKSIYVRPGATVLALPVTVVWDVITFPFQLIWQVYPYGEENAPSEFEGK